MNYFKSIIFSLFVSCVLQGTTWTDCSREFDSAESLAIQTGLQNRNLGDILISDVVDAGAAQVAHGIGDAKATGTLGELGHKAAHGALAFTGAKLTGRDPVGAAVGAVVGEIAAESKAQSAGDRALEKTMQAACSADHKLSKAEFDALLKENLDTEMHRCILTGQLAGASAAFLAGRDVASAQSAAQNATENNFALTTAVAVGTGAVLVAANVYDYYQAYTEGGWNAVQAKWDEERALDTSLATAGAGAGMAIGPVGSAVGAAGGAIVGNATLRTKSILQRLIKKATLKNEKKATQLEFDFVKDVKLGQSGSVGETVVNAEKVSKNISESQIVKQRLQNASQQAYNYAVDSLNTSGLKRTEIGLKSEQKATRWISKWLKREGITGVNFQVPGSVSRPDMVHYDSKTLFDFKLTPKAIRPKQKQGFLTDFPDYEIQYIFGPGEWRGNK